nr:GEL complex subunit OPTI isoform X1 [Kogia breviceps]
MSGGRRKEEPPQPQLANGALKVSVWSKVLRSDAAWEDKDEFLDVIYWFRQIIAVVLGVIWGVLPLRGFLGIAGFCLINAGVLYLYFSNYLQIDEEEYGGTWELTKEGFMTSFALFMNLAQTTKSESLGGGAQASLCMFLKSPQDWKGESGLRISALFDMKLTGYDVVLFSRLLLMLTLTSSTVCFTCIISTRITLSPRTLVSVWQGERLIQGPFGSTGRWSWALLETA